MKLGVRMTDGVGNKSIMKSTSIGSSEREKQPILIFSHADGGREGGTSEYHTAVYWEAE